MHKAKLYGLVAGGLLVLAAGPTFAVLAVQESTRRIEEAIERLIQHEARIEAMQLSNTWTYETSPGTTGTKTVTTTQDPDEDLQAFRDRHAAEVAYWQDPSRCPPV